MGQFEAILFDLNGVIADDEFLHEISFAKALEKNGFSLTHADYEAFFLGRADREGLMAFVGAQAENMSVEVVLRQKSQWYKELSASKLRSYPGAITLLNELAHCSIRRALVTGANKSEVKNILEALNLEQVFEVITSAEDVTTGKPSPEPYLRTSRSLGVKPERCMVLEDSPMGIRSAKAAGMFCVAVAHTYDCSRLLEADLVISDLDKGSRAEVMKLLEVMK